MSESYKESVGKSKKSRDSNLTTDLTIACINIDILLDILNSDEIEITPDVIEHISATYFTFDLQHVVEMLLGSNNIPLVNLLLLLLKKNWIIVGDNTKIPILLERILKIPYGSSFS